MPISFVRRVTLYAITPYNPIAASSAAITPNDPTTPANIRSPANVIRICSSCVRIPATGTFRSISDTTLCTAPAIAIGGIAVRSSNVIPPQVNSFCK